MMPSLTRRRWKKCPQITQITQIFLFFIICVNLWNLWAFFMAAPHEAAATPRDVWKLYSQFINSIVDASRLDLSSPVRAIHTCLYGVWWIKPWSIYNWVYVYFFFASLRVSSRLIFIVAPHDCARAFARKRMKTDTNGLAQHIGSPRRGVFLAE